LDPAAKARSFEQWAGVILDTHFYLSKRSIVRISFEILTFNVNDFTRFSKLIEIVTPDA